MFNVLPPHCTSYAIQYNNESFVFCPIDTKPYKLRNYNKIGSRSLQGGRKCPLMISCTYKDEVNSLKICFEGIEKVLKELLEKLTKQGEEPSDQII
jgi:hypothetical protein